MKRINKLAVIGLIGALAGSGIPAMAGQDGRDFHDRSGVRSSAAQYDNHQRDDHRRDDRGWNDRNRGYNQDRDRREYRDNGRYGEYRGGYTSGYQGGPVYEPAPVYGGPVYEGSPYYDGRTHDGRAAAIIGSSAATGAIIGAAAGRGQGAIIGAVIGGIAGVAANAAVDHHRRY